MEGDPLAYGHIAIFCLAADELKLPVADHQQIAPRPTRPCCSFDDIYVFCPDQLPKCRHINTTANKRDC